jgi:predicted glycogen debranching enzyme
MITFKADVCANFDAATQREWLETNGLGGYASSSLAAANTRRYHGLLVAAVRPPVGRFVLLSKLEEVLIVSGNRYELSANQYPGVVQPQGFRYLKEFRLDPFPIFTFDIEGVEVEKTIFMVHRENTTVVQYRLMSSAAANCELEIRPLIAFRDYHSTTHENGALDSHVAQEPGIASVQPYVGLPSLFLGHNAAQVDAQGYWYRTFEYLEEQRRGLDFTEDLFSPMTLHFNLQPAEPATIVASTEKRAAAQAERYRRAEISRRKELVRTVDPDPAIQSLALAADQFIVSRGEQKTVIAGYHWFGDWGRDTMIALPGLTLATGRPEIAKSILKTFAQHADQGMLPNRFPDAAESPEYNTVDGTLWFFEAARAYLEHTGDAQFVQETLYPVLSEMVAWHVRGARYGIKVDSSGLLSAGEPGVQLTWMDAKVGDCVVTPRHGKPVEIQALWYNALCIMEGLAQRFGDEAGRKRYHSMAAVTRWSFNRLFWNEDAGCLYDVVNGGPPDDSIRPNQIFAVSLPHSMLSEERARKVVAVVERALLTPYGLRTLARSDPRYRPRYEGGILERDSAYHQGTVWPWLLGPFITAYVKVHGNSQEAQDRATGWLAPVMELTREKGLGQICEILDGDPPHRPCGCIAQAWSVAEILRAATEALAQIQPHGGRAKVANAVAV